MGANGNDLLIGHHGRDFVRGHGGHDTIFAGEVNTAWLTNEDAVDQNGTFDTAGNYVVGDGGDDTIFGTRRNDVLIGDTALWNKDSQIDVTFVDLIMPELKRFLTDTLATQVPWWNEEVLEELVEQRIGQEVRTLKEVLTICSTSPAKFVASFVENGVALPPFGLEFDSEDSGQNVIYGGDDTDWIVGGDDLDVLLGNAGDDFIVGDTFDTPANAGTEFFRWFDDAMDLVNIGTSLGLSKSLGRAASTLTGWFESGATGLKWIGKASAHIARALAVVDIATYHFASPINNTGSGTDDVIVGGDGNDYLVGCGGSDSMFAGRVIPVELDEASESEFFDNMWGGQDADFMYNANAIGDLAASELLRSRDSLRPSFAESQQAAMYGNEGRDTITSGNGGSVIFGEGPNATGEAAAESDLTHEGFYSWFYQAASARSSTPDVAPLSGDTILASGGMNWIVGGYGADNISGGSDDDYIIGDYIDTTEWDFLLSGDRFEAVLLETLGLPPLFPKYLPVKVEHVTYRDVFVEAARGGELFDRAKPFYDIFMCPGSVQGGLHG